MDLFPAKERLWLYNKHWLLLLTTSSVPPPSWGSPPVIKYRHLKVEDVRLKVKRLDSICWTWLKAKASARFCHKAQVERQQVKG